MHELNRPIRKRLPLIEVDFFPPSPIVLLNNVERVQKDEGVICDRHMMVQRTKMGYVAVTRVRRKHGRHAQARTTLRGHVEREDVREPTLRHDFQGCNT
jgi:hypothetical protein